MGSSHFALVDTGAKWENGYGSTVAVDWLKSHGVEHLDWMLITHQHGDHMEDAVSILENIEVNTLYMKHYDGTWVLRGVTDEDKARELLGADDDTVLQMSGDYYLRSDGSLMLTSSTTGSYANILKAALSHGTKVIGPSWTEVDPNSPTCLSTSPSLYNLSSWSKWLEENADSSTSEMFEPFDESNVRFNFGPAEIEIVNWQEYDTYGAIWNEYSSFAHEIVVNENENSLGVIVQIGDTRAFLAGDIESSRDWNGIAKRQYELNDEERIAERVGDVDFYKVAHHGYNTSTSEALMEVMRPEAAMITNMVGQASDKVTGRLDKWGCTYMYTTEDPVETVVELSPDAVRMMRASEEWWRYETPYHEVTVRDGVDGSVLATLEVRDGRAAEWPAGFEAPAHDGWRLAGDSLPELPDYVRADCQVVVQYEKAA